MFYEHQNILGCVCVTESGKSFFFSTNMKEFFIFILNSLQKSECILQFIEEQKPILTLNGKEKKFLCIWVIWFGI